MIPPIRSIQTRNIRPVSAVAPPARYAAPEDTPFRPLLQHDVMAHMTRHLRRSAVSVTDWLAAAGAAAESARRLSADSSGWRRRRVTAYPADGLWGEAADDAGMTGYCIEIDRAARRQLNRGFELVKHAASVIEPGSHLFRLTTGGKTMTLTVQIGAEETNGQVLARLRDIINGTGAGVRADVKEDEKQGIVWLEIASADTGAAGAFELADTDGSAVSAAGIGTAAITAEDAIYQVDDGPVRVSPVNEAVLDRGRVRIMWRETTEGAYDIRIGPDAEWIVQRVRQTVADADALAGVVRSHAAYLNLSLARQLEQIMDTDAARRIGIERTDEGWTVDEERLRAEIRRRPEAVKRDLAGPSGWTGELIQWTDRLRALPAEALLSSFARGVSTYAPYASGARLHAMTPAGGWYYNYLYG